MTPIEMQSQKGGGGGGVLLFPLKCVKYSPVTQSKLYLSEHYTITLDQKTKQKQNLVFSWVFFFCSLCF